MKRHLILGALVVLVLVYPLLTAGFPVYERLGALVLLAAIGASAWNIVGGYAGQVSVGHAVFFGFGAYSSVVVYTHLGWPPIAGAPLGMLLSVAVAAVIGVPTLQALRPLFQHGHHRRRRAGARAELDLGVPGRRAGAGRARHAAHRVRPLLHLGDAVLLHLPRRAGASCSG